MRNLDRIEIYNKDKMIGSVKSSIVPAVGSYINVCKKVWKITSVTFAVDYSTDTALSGMRCNIDVKEIKYKETK